MSCHTPQVSNLDSSSLATHVAGLSVFRAQQDHCHEISAQRYLIFRMGFESCLAVPLELSLTFPTSHVEVRQGWVQSAFYLTSVRTHNSSVAMLIQAHPSDHLTSAARLLSCWRGFFAVNPRYNSRANLCHSHCEISRTSQIWSFHTKPLADNFRFDHQVIPCPGMQWQLLEFGPS